MRLHRHAMGSAEKPFPDLLTLRELQGGTTWHEHVPPLPSYFFRGGGVPSRATNSQRLWPRTGPKTGPKYLQAGDSAEPRHQQPKGGRERKEIRCRETSGAVRLPRWVLPEKDPPPEGVRHRAARE